MLSLRVLPLLVILSSLFLLSSAQTSWTQVSILRLSSPNCTQSGSTITNCPFPTTALITTSGWGQLSLNNIFLVITASDGTELGVNGGPGGQGGSGLSVYSGDNGANATLQATIMPQQFTPSLLPTSAMATQPLNNVSIRTWGPGGATTAVPLITFAYDSGPTLSSVSGCTGSNPTTSCDPAVAVLTFAGSGFRWYSNPGAVQLWIGTAFTTVAGFGGPGNVPSLSVQSDTLMTVNMATAYTYLLLPPHYGGALLPIFFNENRFTGGPNGMSVPSYTNSLNISFIPQPAPNVTATWTGGGSACAGSNNTGPYNNCVPGVSYIDILGSYIYDVNITVGGVPCYSLIPQTSSRTRCQLPNLPGVGPYDLVVTDPNAFSSAVFTSPGFISFRSGPTISSVTTCVNTGISNNNDLFFGGFCFEGQTITIQGNNLPTGDSTAYVQIRQQGFPGSTGLLNFTCNGTSVLSSSAITCTLPYLAQQTPSAVALYGANAQVQVFFTSGTTSTNSLGLTLYNYPQAPIITSIQGCGGGPALYAYNCGSGATLTINGQNLANGTTWMVQVVPVTGNGPSFFPSAWSCNVVSTSVSQLFCTMPTFNAQVSPVQMNTLYQVTVNVVQGGFGSGANQFPLAASNVIYVSFNLGTGVTSWSQVQVTSVSSPQCSNQGVAAINCGFPATVTITTTGYGALSTNQAFLVLTGPDGTELGVGGGSGGQGLQRSPYDQGQNMYLQATIYPSQYTPTLVASSASATAPLLALTIRSFQGQSSTAPVSLISFAYDAGPSLSTVSGCTGSTPTLQCDPAVAVLTFTGSGFKWYSNSGSVQMWINNQGTPVNGGNNPSLSVQSDTQMTVNMNQSYAYLLLPPHYGGQQVPVFFNENRFTGGPTGTVVPSYSNTLYISFIPQPAPVVNNIYIPGGGGQCSGSNYSRSASNTAFTNCIPNLSYITLSGQYMYDVTVTVGGVPCASQVSVSATQLRCLLPYVGGAGPFDLVISDPNAATQVNVPITGLISYRTTPSISAVTTCTDTGSVNQQGFWFGGYCFEGTTVTISGASFPASDSSLAVMISYQYQGPWWGRPAYAQGTISVNCNSPTIVSSTALTCVLPTLAGQTGAGANASLAFYGQYVQVQASFASGATTTNSLTLPLFQWPQAPVITSVSGCPTSNSALSLSNCQSGATLTINGRNLYNSSINFPPLILPVPYTNTWSCALAFTSASQIVCTLPTFDPQVSPVLSGVTYAMNDVVETAQFSQQFMTSNAFRLDFTPQSSSSSSSGLSTAGKIAVGVVIPVAVIALVCLLVMCYMNKGGKMKLSMPSINTRKGESYGKHMDSEQTESDVEMK